MIAGGQAPSVKDYLKPPSGRFPVGFIDVEWDDVKELLEQAGDSEAERIKLVGDDLPLILVRIYYPAEESSATVPRGPWIPSSHYFPGYGYFLRMPPLISSGIARLLASNVCLWAKENLAFCPGLSAPVPVAIFSHGLGGIRTTYSTICCDLASRGMVVVALEHRDGSASFTLVGAGYQQQQLQSRKPTSIRYTVGPSGLTSHNSDWTYRAAQLRRRQAELRSTFNFLMRLNDKHDSIESSLISQHPAGLLDTFKGKLDLENIITIGHSFGALTALSFAQHQPNVVCCIAYDPWMFPLTSTGLDYSSRSTALTALIVHNEHFTWPENDAALDKLVTLLSENHRIVKVKMLGCGHMDQSDLVSIVPARIISMVRPNAILHDNPHPILQANLDVAAVILSHALPQYNFMIDNDSVSGYNFEYKLPEKFNFIRFETIKL